VLPPRRHGQLTKAEVIERALRLGLRDLDTLLQEEDSPFTELRALLPADTLQVLRRRAEEALAEDGVACARLGYDVLVKLKLEELLEREFMPSDVSDDGGHGESAVT
jgi:hypothetical protein